MVYVEYLDDLDVSCPAGQEWERLVSSNPASGFMQSLLWRDFKRQQGLDSIHLILRDDGRMVGGGIFYTGRRNGGKGFFVAPEGPVLPWEHREEAEQLLQLLVAELESCASTYGAMAVRIEPRLPAESPLSAEPGLHVDTAVRAAGVLTGFGPAPVDLIPRETLYLNIDQSLDQVLSQMRPKGRYNIRLSARHGVTVFEDNSPSAIKNFYPVLMEAAARDGFFIEPMPFFLELMHTLCPSGMARVLFAEHEGEILGTLLLITYGARATYLYGGITNRKRNVMAGYSLQWEAMQLARAAGCTHYDFYGFDQFGSPLNRYARFSRFKKLFGGQPIRFVGAQDRFFMENLAEAVIRALKEVTEVSNDADKIAAIN